MFAKNYTTLKVGQVQEIDSLLTQLVNVGYQRVEMVEKPGEYSVRGGIVDIYPVHFENPVRVEWFDDEVDSIRPFSVSDQRSFDKWEELTIPPAKELFASADELYQAGEKVEKRLGERLRSPKRLN